MISTLLIILVVCLFFSWVTLMGIWWQKEHRTEQVFSFEETLSYYSQYSSRLFRRGWYRCTFYLSLCNRWCSKKVAKLFFSVFPNAEPAFTKKDTLTGLEHGPSSFFLKSISEKEKGKSRKNSPIAKK